MKNKRLLILGLAFVLLVIVAFIVMQGPGEQSMTTSEGNPLVDIDSALVTKVEIITPAHRVTVVKRGAEWYLEEPMSYRADQRAVASLIGQVESLRSKSVVSANPEKQELFQVDTTGTLITLHGSGEPAASVIIGKMGATYTETYVRLATSDEVHVVNASLAFVGSRGANDWRDKTILTVPREEIRAVQYQYGDTAFTLAFHDSLWTVDGVPADDGSVNTLLSALSNVQADEFLDTPPSSLPVIKAVVAYAGREIRFYEGRASDSYRVQTSAGEQWFEVKSWRAEQILKRKEDLRAQTT